MKRLLTKITAWLMVFMLLTNTMASATEIVSQNTVTLADKGVTERPDGEDETGEGDPQESDARDISKVLKNLTVYFTDADNNPVSPKEAGGNEYELVAGQVYHVYFEDLDIDTLEAGRY